MVLPRVLSSAVIMGSCLLLSLQAQDVSNPATVGRAGQDAVQDEGTESPLRPAVLQAVPPALRDQYAALCRGLLTWPDVGAHRAARSLAALGRPVTQALLESLKETDWRIRAGSAWALGELRAGVAFSSLQKYALDISNRIAISTYFEALVKIDPVSATDIMLSQMVSGVSRVRKAAFEVLPDTVDVSFERRLLKYSQTSDPELRFRAFQILRRLGGPTTSSVWYGAFADVSPKVARLAADVVSELDPAMHAKALNDLITSGTLRKASYACIAITLAEDRTNQALISGGKPLVDRLFRLLKIRGDLENAAAAIALANLSMRSSDPRIRRVADGGLMYFLINAAFGGIIFPDYNSVKGLCLSKARMLSGRDHGEDGTAWKAWWGSNAGKFVAKRELTGLEGVRSREITVSYACRLSGEKDMRLLVSGSGPSADAPVSRRPVFLTSEELGVLGKVIGDVGFFDSRGHRENPAWTGDFVDVTVAAKHNHFRRVHYGEPPDALLQLEKTLVRLVWSNAWQYFWDRRRGVKFSEWFEETRVLVKGLSEEERIREFRKMALVAFSGLGARGHDLALQMFESSEPGWIEDRRTEFVELVAPETLSTSILDRLLQLIGRLPGFETAQATLDRFPLLEKRDRDLVQSYMRGLSNETILALASSERPAIRAAVVRELVVRLPGAPMARALVHAAEDDDSLVRRAFMQYVKGKPASQVLPGLEARVLDDTVGPKLRLVETIGRVGGDGGVEVLKRIYASGTLPVQSACLRGFGGGATEVGIGELFRIVATGGNESLHLEALSVLAAMDSPSVAGRFRVLINGEEDPKRLMSYISPAMVVFAGSLREDMVPLLSSKHREVCSATALLLASQGIEASVPPLLDMLQQKGQLGLAREHLEGLTFLRVNAVDPGILHKSYLEWWGTHSKETRRQWFSSAIDAAGFKSRELAGWLQGADRDLRAANLLIDVVRTADFWALRVQAHHALAGMKGSSVGILTRHSTPREISRVVEKWEDWYRVVQSGR